MEYTHKHTQTHIHTMWILISTCEIVIASPVRGKGLQEVQILTHQFSQLFFFIIDTFIFNLFLFLPVFLFCFSVPVLISFRRSRSPALRSVCLAVIRRAGRADIKLTGAINDRRRAVSRAGGKERAGERGRK